MKITWEIILMPNNEDWTKNDVSFRKKFATVPQSINEEKIKTLFKI
jgi:hypothetical protein